LGRNQSARIAALRSAEFRLAATCQLARIPALSLVRTPYRVRQRRAEDRYGELAAFDAHTHPAGMFVVTEAEAAAIRAVYEQRGELSAAIELRRLFPSITDTAQARACARTIAGWKPLPRSRTR
jgi:hypothetical protein